MNIVDWKVRPAAVYGTLSLILNMNLYLSYFRVSTYPPLVHPEVL